MCREYHSRNGMKMAYGYSFGIKCIYLNLSIDISSFIWTRPEQEFGRIANECKPVITLTQPLTSSKDQVKETI